jgi:hypothetical protein
VSAQVSAELAAGVGGQHVGAGQQLLGGIVGQCRIEFPLEVGDQLIGNTDQLRLLVDARHV